jgi:ligand-binding SRPBCC domain-containing protein
MERVFRTEQVVPASLQDTFAFFADAGNLETITPPWLRFHIIAQSTPRIALGTELTYRLRIHRIPVTWRTRIEEWVPNERFVDVQLHGPYATWQHTHRFRTEGSATRIEDEVVYRLPLGALGDLVAGRFVARDVAEIFAYRAERTRELLARP